MRPFTRRCLTCSLVPRTALTALTALKNRSFPRVSGLSPYPPSGLIECQGSRSLAEAGGLVDYRRLPVSPRAITLAATIEQAAYAQRTGPAGPNPRPIRGMVTPLLPHLCPVKSRSPLTNEQAVALWKACLENADQLAGEAQLLLDAGRDPRAFALAEFVHEELAKTMALMKAWSDPNSINWPKFWEQWRAHGFKIQVAVGLDATRQASGSGWDRVSSEQLLEVQPDLPLPGDFGAEIERFLRHVNAQASNYRLVVRQREDALYVDFRQGAVSSPTAAISPEMAKAMVAAAKENLAFMRYFDQAFIPAYEGLMKLPVFQQIMDALNSAAARLEKAKELEQPS